MKKFDFFVYKYCLVACIFFGASSLLEAQVSVQRCYTASPSFSANGVVQSMPGVNFTGAFPAGSVITGIDVEIVWSKAGGTCAAPNLGATVDLAEVGFGLQSPFGFSYFAPSANNPVAGTPSWTGSTAFGAITTNFSVTPPNITLPVTALPQNGQTYRDNGTALTQWNGQSAGGTWSLIVIDDANDASPTCVESYCITVHSCLPSSLNAFCAPGPIPLSIDSFGILAVEFEDIDGGSDTSCWLSSINITPNNFTCADIGSTQNLTMTLTDQFGTSRSCVSTIEVVDNIGPVLDCRNYTIELDSFGNFDFLAADSLVATDNCGGPISYRINNQPSFTYTCANAGGANLATFSAIDAQGNTTTCPAGTTVTVNYTIAPDAVCQDIDVYLNAAGELTVDALDIDGGSTVVCPFISLRRIDGSASRVYTCADLGANTATLEVQHFSGLTGTCTSTVTVFDTLSPDAQCQNISAFLNPAGAVTVQATDINNGSSDNCTPVASLSYSFGGATSLAYSCAQVGTPQNVTLTVTDAAGNFSTCNAVITVEDTISPQAICQNITTYVDAAGTVTVTGAELDGGSSDACSGTALTYTVNNNPSVSFDCSVLGTPQTVGLRVFDASGNQEYCEADVLVLDTLNPVAQCRQDLPVFLDATGDVIVTAASLDSLSTDNCGSPLSFNIAGAPQTSFSCAQLNTVQSINLTVEDASGNQDLCVATVRVLDNIAPTALCQDRTVNLSATNPGTVTVNANQIDGGSSDNCGAASLSFLINGQPSISYTCASTSAAGNAVTLTVEDASGNQSFCNARIFVVDNTPPTVICRNITRNIGAAGTVSITANEIRNPASFDNCGIVSATINGAATETYDCNDVAVLAGTQTAVLRLVDAAGNDNTCNATITILDNIAPTAQCNNINAFLDAAGVVTVDAVDLRAASSSDNCSIVSTEVNGGQPSVSFDCNDLGPNIVTLELRDPSNNLGTCDATVTVRDAIAPVAQCQAFTANLNASGQVTVTAAQIDGGSTDNCPGSLTFTINGAPDFSYDCSDVGLNSALLTVRDAEGNQNTCLADVTVVDNIPPTAVCHPTRTVNLSATTGTASLLASQVNNGSSDNCSNLSFSFSGGANSRSFTCANVGTPVTVDLVVTDASGTTATCASTVTVNDVTAPSIICTSPTVYVGPAGTIIVAATSLATATDNCGAPTITIVGSGANETFNCADIGTSTPLTLRATDAAGLFSECTSTVTVEDTLRPNAQCRPATLTLNPAGVATLDPLDIDNGSTDNCPPVSLSLSRTNFGCADVGTPQTVTLTVSDASGNTRSCQAQVDVLDTEDPEAWCFANRTVFLDNTGQGSIDAVNLDSASTDNCAIASRTIGGATTVNFDCSDLGTRVLTLQVEDAGGLTATCNTTVEIRDAIAPTVTCTPLTAYLDAAGLVTVAAADLATATDNCPNPVLTVAGQPTVSFTCSDIGVNNLTVTATDASGLSASCPVVVTVEDTLAPIALCQAAINLNLDANGEANLAAVDLDNGSSDNCTTITLAINQTLFDCSNVGANTVTLTVTDAQGLVDDCQATVNVNDPIAPTANCRPDTLYLGTGPNPSVTLLPSLIDDNSNDNCAITNRLVNGQPSLSFDCADIGLQSITLEVSDQAGLTATCLADVTILDTLSPVVTCNSPTLDLSNVGLLTVPATSLISATDNCAGVAVRFQGGANSVNFTCADVGSNAFVMEAEDASGLITSCAVTVTVRDVTPPTAGCQNITVSINNAGVTLIPAMLISNGSNDACGIDTMFVTPDIVTCADVGLASGVSVVLTVIDNNGLQGTCNATVTVQDNTAPTVLCQNVDAYLNAAGQVTVTALEVDNGSVDSCGIASYTINGLAQIDYSCVDTGVQTVTLRVTDNNGNFDECTADITVRDTLAPTALCQAPFTGYLDASGDFSLFPADVDNGSTDNCGLNPAAFRINGQAQLDFDCSDIGTPQTITLEVFDISGQSATCQTTLSIEDTLAPIAQCVATPITLVLSPTPPAIATLAAVDLDAGSSDNCTTISFSINGQATATFGCADVGTNTVTLTVTDAQGLSSTCTAQVEVEDQVLPVASCRGNILNINLDSSGQAFFPAINLNSNSTDNCGIVSYQIGGQDTVTFTCADVGNNTLTLTVSDAQGNQATCTGVVNVRDNISPVAICPTQPVPAYVNASGLAVVTAAEIDSASFDNCAITSRLINGAATRQYSCANVGTIVPVTLTVSDGTSSTNCLASVEVFDTVAPTALCQDITVSLDAQGLVNVSAAAINAGSNDNCGTVRNLLINGQNQVTYDCGDIGAVGLLATLSMEDASGNTAFCTSTITVEDNLNPTLNCTPFTAYLNPAGDATVSPPDVATWSDNCGVLNWNINGLPSVTYTCTSIGQTTTETITVEDLNGNTASCQVPVTVLDTISPEAFCRNTFTANLDATGQVTVTAAQIDNGSIDNCAIDQYFINNAASVTYTCADIGTNTATLRVVDASGNEDECTTTIEVADIIPPTALCLGSFDAILDPSGQVTVQAADLDNGSTDACGPLVFTINGQASRSFDCSNAGNNIVTLTITDNNGNGLSSQCNVNIAVLDTTPPAANCQDITVYLGPAGTVQVTPQQIDGNPASFDNCQIATYRINNANFASYDCSNIGANTATLQVIDIYGNDSTCQATITVEDTIPPTVVCQNITVNLSASGPRTLTPADLDPTNSTADACGIDQLYVLPDLIRCEDVVAGQVEVWLYAVDNNGNIDSCQSIVTVQVNQPNATANAAVLCEGDNLQLTANAPAGQTYNYAWAGPDGFTSTQANPLVAGVTGANAGDYLLTITPTTGAGCPAFATVTVDVNVVDEPILAANTPLCEGNDGFVYLDNVGQYTGTNVNFTWYFDNQLVTGVTGDTLFLPAANQANSGSYSMVVEVDGCRDSNRIIPFTLIVNDLPAAPQPTASNPCEGDALSLFVTPQDSSRTYTYEWNGPSGFSSTDADPLITPISQANAGVYNVTITDANTCTATANVQALIRQRPQLPQLEYNEPLCLDDFLQLTDSRSYFGAPISYEWTLPNQSSQTTSIGQLLLTDGEAGAYQLQVTINGCPSPIASIDVTYEPAPIALNDAFTVPFRDSLVGLAVIANDQFGTGFSIELLDSTRNGIVVNNANGTFDYSPRYSFFGRDSFSYVICDALCPTSCDTALVSIEVTTEFECFIPNAISPNGDGLNDELNIRCVHDYPEASLQIFSRWGTRVYEGPMLGFNGQFNGKDLPDGTYFYLLNLNDRTHVPNDQFSGYLIIQR